MHAHAPPSFEPPQYAPDGDARVAPISDHRRVAVVAVHHVRVGGQTFTGGAEKYLQQSIGALLDAGANVHVGYSGSSVYDDLLLRAHPTQLTVERTGWLNEVLSGDARLKWSTIRDRRRWLRAARADTLFVVQQGGGGAFGASIVAARSLGMRVVASMRQTPEPLPPADHKRWLGMIPAPQLWRRRLIWRRRIPAWCCDAIIFNSRRIADAFHREYAYPRHRFRIIPNGEAPRDHNRLPPPTPPCHLATAGRVTEAKGADVLLDAFAIVAERHPATRLTYYGDGPLVPDLRAKARAMGLGDRVAFPGYRNDREEIFSDVDIYVQPSRREAMSNSVIEAMARGIPCVVSDVGGLPEAVTHGQTGFVVPANEPQACATAICRLLSDRETFARFSRAAGERARALFDIHRVMRETVETILGTAVEGVA